MTGAHAPGRVELLGNHTDYNDGFVLGAAIDRRLKVEGEKRNDETIRFIGRSSAKSKFTFPSYIR